jgi:acyl-CoA synthetase (AMP-forming)/AMP-acid ligase II
MSNIQHKNNTQLYILTTGQFIDSLIPFSSPADEYRIAFEDRAGLFVNYFSFTEDKIKKLTITRGEFWDMACSAAVYLKDKGFSKSDRCLHCFSSNSLYDLVFRLAAVLTGYVPVTINWQADDDECIRYKAEITDAKLILCDDGFAYRAKNIADSLAIPCIRADKVHEYQTDVNVVYPTLTYGDERMIIFTSGTTGRPKGASLSHRSYLANKLTFEQYFGISGDAELDLLLVNPLHHTNSSALSDWGMRHSGAIIHMLQHYSTTYWKILVDVVGEKRNILVTSLVSRHIDFLESLSNKSNLPVKEGKLKEALRQTDILIGSAPVGPTTIKRILKFSGRLPHVRFGSTETCLEVMATPRELLQTELLKAFEAGWSHRYKGEAMPGYYIGREHFPTTRVRVVKAVDPESKDYLRTCEIGEPGYLITQGPNIMSYYVGDKAATKAFFREGWYTGLRDIVFTLRNEKDGELDYYWMSRDSALLIRGGANYAYDQIAAELSQFVAEHFHIKPEQFQLAVVGIRLESEHEDSCCVTIELSKEAPYTAEAELRANFLTKAAAGVSKGTRPQHLRFGIIPRSFKGALLYPQLKQDYADFLKSDRDGLK